MIIVTLIKNYLKNFGWKDLIYLGTLLFILFFLKNCHIGSPDSTNVVIKPALKPTVQMKDKAGNTYTEVQGTLFTEKEMRHVTDSFEKVLGKGKVVHVIETITVIDTEYKVEKVNINTINGIVSAQDSNKNSQISFNGNYRLKTGSFHLRLTPDTASYITSIQTHWFKATNITVNIYHTNELFVPSMGTVYTSKVPKTIACIGPVAGIGYNGKPFPFIGIGITLNVIGIKIKN
jgi:uncharacterized protein YxjI